ncbi:MAG: hypothetical protein FWB88_12435 [Defluviitaleaceae bacterium]|nr:hypothetical protein [Defluviitaleaceae bacterium]MCL2240732.1 hypothetical protein [Defluviitaleaceae bacterium]
MRQIIQNLLWAIATYGIWAYGGLGVGADTVLWNMYAHKAIAAYSDEEMKKDSPAHPLVIEAKREAPAHPPPARLFVSAEGRYAIQQGWIAGADYQENKIATHGEAVAMIMQIASLYPEDIIYFGEFNPELPLTRQDFTQYLRVVFHDLPEQGILDADANGDSDPQREVTLVEMVRAAYRLRGMNPHSY